MRPSGAPQDCKTHYYYYALREAPKAGGWAGKCSVLSQVVLKRPLITMASQHPPQPTSQPTAQPTTHSQLGWLSTKAVGFMSRLSPLALRMTCCSRWLRWLAYASNDMGPLGPLGGGEPRQAGGAREQRQSGESEAGCHAANAHTSQSTYFIVQDCFRGTESDEGLPHPSHTSHTRAFEHPDRVEQPSRPTPPTPSTPACVSATIVLSHSPAPRLSDRTRSAGSSPPVLAVASSLST